MKLYKLNYLRQRKHYWTYKITGPGVEMKCHVTGEKEIIKGKIQRTLDRMNGNSAKWNTKL